MQQPDSKPETTFTDIFEMYCYPGRAARLTVSYREGDGVFYFADGELLAAQMGDLTGEEAFRAAAHLHPADYRLDLDVTMPTRTIFSDWADLLPGSRPDADETSGRNKNNRSQTDAAQAAGSAAGLARPVAADTDNGKSAGETTSDAARVTAVDLYVEEDSMEINTRHQSPDSFLPANAGIPGGPDDYHDIQQSLDATGIVVSGVIVDEDGVIVGQLGDAVDDLAQTAYLIVGLEALVSSQFDMGQCEGAMLDHQGVTTLVTNAQGLACAFVPAPRVSVARAFHETRRALTPQSGGEA